ncbi:hypothetical protein HK101_004035 [Irineochytrium annulatum]|nr:hypothetical protein HK101_004035 [Irineochytrium annulatum]
MGHHLRDLGYHFVDDKLVKLDGSPYEFVVEKDNHKVNQKHYEDVGDAIVEYIEELLQSKYGLMAVHLPVDAPQGSPRSVIYMSPDALTSEKPLLMLVPGSAIKVGQWARKIVINESLHRGSMFAYIERAQSEGLSVVVLNNNLNVDKDGNDIPGSDSPMRHVATVWDDFVMKAAAKDVAIVAHSYGGYCVSALVEAREDEVKERVKAIAFTDSVHSNQYSKSSVKSLMQKIAINWVRSELPLDSKERGMGNGCKSLSAGTTSHDQTTVKAIDSVFNFILHQIRE